MKAGPVRSNEGSKDTQLNGSADLEFLDAAEELRQLQTPIPSKAGAIREAVMEAIKQSAIKQNTFEQS
jgi:hypothetical protein